MDKKTTRDELELRLPTKSPEKKQYGTVRCPVCGLSRNKGNHSKCSRITQMRNRQTIKDS